jgi:DNA-binding response OmpR family regulator
MSQETVTKILLVEDDREVREMVGEMLKLAGYDVTEAADGVAGAAAFNPDFGLVILDVEMPYKSGLELLKEIRERSGTPVLILSSRSDISDRVLGLDLGADDYLAKPFEVEELLARVRAHLRRSDRKKEQARGLRVDAEEGRVYIDGEPVKLTAREFGVVSTMAAHPGKNFTREELFERVWGLDSEATTRQVDLIISKVRGKFKKLGKGKLIASVWGVGYRFEG